MRIYAHVEEKEEVVFVATLNNREVDDMGDHGIEVMVRDWCKKQNPPLTFIDYAC